MYSKILLNLKGDKLKQTKKKLSKQRNKIKNKDDLYRSIRRKLQQKYALPLKKELKKAPPKRRYPDDYPINFVSDRQRRFVMDKLNGKPYERTNSIVNGWDVKIVQRQNKMSFRVKNDIEESKFVVGRYGIGESQRSFIRYLKPIQPYHLKTGWEPAYKKIGPTIREAKIEAEKLLNEWLNESLR